MRIAIYHNLPSGGAKRALFEWAQRLAVSNELDIYTLTTSDHAFCNLSQVTQNYHVYDFTPNKLFSRPWGRINRLQRWRDLRSLAQLGRQVARQINGGGYDVLFAHPCLYYSFIPVFLRFITIPTLYYLHEPFGPSFKRDYRRPYLKDDRWRKLSLQFDPFSLLYETSLESARLSSIKRATLLLANSRFTQQQMRRTYQVDTPVCYYGVNTVDFHPIPDIKKENYLISVGELTPRKGFDFLIEALGHLSSDHRPPLRLVCNAVNLEEKRYLEELAALHEVDLRIVQGLGTAQLAAEYNRAQLCLYAPVLEPLGLVPLEAMACGTPVIGVGEAGVKETIRHGETGILVDRDTGSFARSVHALLTQPALASKLGRQGTEYVRKHWTWQKSLESLEAYLLAVANS